MFPLLEKLDECPRCNKDFPTQMAYDMQACPYCELKAGTLMHGEPRKRDDAASAPPDDLLRRLRVSAKIVRAAKPANIFGRHWTDDVAADIDAARERLAGLED